MENKSKLIQYWVKSSDYDLEAARDLLKTGKYAHSLFFGHLAVEKILKAVFIKTSAEYPPKTHNLMMLAKSTGLDMTEEMLNNLIEINTFNIEARYPDEKFEFYEKYSDEAASASITTIMDVIQWLKEKL